jgi:surface antigen
MMVVGKLLILLTSIPASANGIENPRFFEYRSGDFVNRLADLSFGWFKTLDVEQKAAYSQSITHALMFAENGQRVAWYQNDASGESVPVVTWPTGSGYCRRLHINAIAYNVQRAMAVTACLDNSSKRWTWISE